ncbi:YtzH-like protein [Gracilibacillus ureilyticus]|uniref:YtzH-like protein n=1 Tax=Gracilibacillus ureilyticus TaxID=531814 RepID=A0A1H9TDB5_9BACI|nr:YtzH-like family protein [Gracilibacillus ureilyticus]SER95235.1 YtzH-like protein [Gracilibacillus ureilyticus]
MVLNIQNQLDLLHDLLSLHAEEGCGSNSECEQIARLIDSIQQQNALHFPLSHHLENIRQYGVNGATTSELDQHILRHQASFDQWLQSIKDSNH